jgi:hypothetical protein
MPEIKSGLGLRTLRTVSPRHGEPSGIEPKSNQKYPNAFAPGIVAA